MKNWRRNRRLISRSLDARARSSMFCSRPEVSSSHSELSRFRKTISNVAGRQQAASAEKSSQMRIQEDSELLCVNSVPRHGGTASRRRPRIRVAIAVGLSSSAYDRFGASYARATKLIALGSPSEHNLPTTGAAPR